MKTKKYELVAEKSIEYFGLKLFRIRALISFGVVSAGEEGGFVESEKNVDQSGNAWVSGNAHVSGNAQVYGNAHVYGDARVSGDAWVSGDARVSGNAHVYGNARVYGDARVSDNAMIPDETQILWMSNVGGELGTLTAFRNSLGGITVTRGCFIGTLDEFRTAVTTKYGGTLLETGYLRLANYIEWHLTELHPLNNIEDFFNRQSEESQSESV